MTKHQEIASRIKALRIKHNLTQKQLASKLYISEQAISKWERAEALPDIENLSTISEVFNVSIDFLLKGEDYQPNEILPYWNQLLKYKEGKDLEQAIMKLSNKDESINLYKSKDIEDKTLLETIAMKEDYQALQYFIRFTNINETFKDFSNYDVLMSIVLVHNDSSLVTFIKERYKQKYSKAYSYNNKKIINTISTHDSQIDLLHEIFSVRSYDDRIVIHNISFILRTIEYIIERGSNKNLTTLLNLLLQTQEEDKFKYLSVYQKAVQCNHEDALVWLEKNGKKIYLYEEALKEGNQSLISKFSKLAFKDEERETLSENIQEYLFNYLNTINRRYTGDKSLQDINDIAQEINFIYDHFSLPTTPKELYLMNKLKEYRDSVNNIDEMILIKDIKSSKKNTFRVIREKYDFGDSWNKRSIELGDPDHIHHKGFVQETIDLLQKEAKPHLKTQDGFERFLSSTGFLGLKIAIMVKDVKTINFIKQFAMDKQLEAELSSTNSVAVRKALIV